MELRDADHGVPDVLEIGRDPRPPGIALVVTIGALCLGTGAALGATLLREDPVPPGTGRVLLSVGSVTENPDVFGSTRYLIPVHNLGDRAVTIQTVSVQGWRTDGGPHETAAVLPGGWQTVPVLADSLCDGVGSDLRLVVVSGAVGDREFRAEIPAYQSLDILMRDQSLRCFGHSGRAPTAEEMRGTWLVRDGEHLPGTILVHFLAQGRLALHDSTKPTVVGSESLRGRWSLTGSEVEVVLDSGQHCSLGTRWTWEVAIEQETTLYLRRAGRAENGCRPDLDRVWAAERVSP